MTVRFAALAAVFAAALGPSAVVAQIAPNDTGAGTQLGIQQLNNSGQVGTVTLFRHGGNTLVVLRLTGEKPGRREPAHIHRGKTCDAIDPKPAFGLAPVVNGVSRTIVQYSEDRLLSGNYVVNVHASDSEMTHYVACGQLYH